jgi:hypothetical protein
MKITGSVYEASTALTPNEVLVYLPLLQKEPSPANLLIQGDMQSTTDPTCGLESSVLELSLDPLTIVYPQIYE